MQRVQLGFYLLLSYTGDTGGSDHGFQFQILIRKQINSSCPQVLCNRTILFYAFIFHAFRQFLTRNRMCV